MARKPNFDDASLKGSLQGIFGAFTPEMIDYLGKFNRMGLQETLETSRELGGEFQQERQRLLEMDPLIRRMRNIAIGGLKGVNQGQLPGDISRSITDRTRKAMAARGMDESSIAATMEAAALTGGAEQFRANRLNQAMAVGDRYSVGGQMLSGGVPDFMSLLPFQQNATAQRNQAAQAQFDAIMGQWQSVGQAAGQITSLLAGGLGGGFGGAMAGMGAAGGGMAGAMGGASSGIGAMGAMGGGQFGANMGGFLGQSSPYG